MMVKDGLSIHSESAQGLPQNLSEAGEGNYEKLGGRLRLSLRGFEEPEKIY